MKDILPSCSITSWRTNALAPSSFDRRLGSGRATRTSLRCWSEQRKGLMSNRSCVLAVAFSSRQDITVVRVRHPPSSQIAPPSKPPRLPQHIASAAAATGHKCGEGNPPSDGSEKEDRHLLGSQTQLPLNIFPSHTSAYLCSCCHPPAMRAAAYYRRQRWRWRSDWCGQQQQLHVDNTCQR
jgi:hypothetical protein